MKNILFTIKTAYSEENYFLKANEEQLIESQIDNALAEICFCDAYEIISYKEVSNEYVEQREKLIKEYEKLSKESFEDAFISLKYTTLEVIQSEIEYIKQRGWKMSEKTKTIHNAYCDYEIAKAKQLSRIYSVRSEVKPKPGGIKTYNMSKAMLARQLASLF